MAQAGKGQKDPREDFKYSEAEIEELLGWFKGKDLPKSLRLDSGTFVPDVARTVALLSEIVRDKQNRTFETTADQLFKIRKLSEEYLNGGNPPMQ